MQESFGPLWSEYIESGEQHRQEGAAGDRAADPYTKAQDAQESSPLDFHGTDKAAREVVNESPIDLYYASSELAVPTTSWGGKESTRARQPCGYSGKYASIIADCSHRLSFVALRLVLVFRQVACAHCCTPGVERGKLDQAR